MTLEIWGSLEPGEFLDKVMEDKVVIRTENTTYVLNPNHVILAFHEFLPSGGKSQIVVYTRNGVLTIKLDDHDNIIGVYLK
jgi:hypothetical protein